VNKRRPNLEDSHPSKTALRQQQFRERLRAERAEPAAPPAREQDAARKQSRALAENPREHRKPEHSTQVREEERSAHEAAVAAVSQALEERAAQAKLQQRAQRASSATQKLSEELSIHAATIQQQTAEQERLHVAAVTEEQRRARREETETRRQEEQRLHAAILQRKEQRRQTAAARSDEEEWIAQRKRAEKEKKPSEPPVEAEPVRREPAVPEPMPVEVAPTTPIQSESPAARIEANRIREENERRAATERQLRIEKEQRRTAEHAIAEASAAIFREERRELKRQTAAQAALESVAPVELPAAPKKTEPAEPQSRLRQDVERRKPPSGLTLAPSALSGGSTAREVSAVSTGIDAASPETSVDATPYLQTQGNFIVDENGDAVTLRGVTVRGLDTVAPQPGQAVPDALSLDKSNLATITDQWGANLVRLPFAAGTILNGNGNLAAGDLLAGLDATVSAITSEGAFVLLALEAVAGESPTDANTLQVWDTLAARFQNEPRVFYEVFASPSPVAGDLAAQFAPVIATIRQHDSASLIFVPGSASGLDVTAVPLRDANGDAVPSVVYTITVSVQSVPNPDVLAAVSAAHPVFASWSDDGSDLGRQSSRVADLFERCGIGWAATNWNSDPRLVSDAAGHDFSPTIWGNVALRAIKLTAPPRFEPADAPPPLATIRAEDRKLPRLSTSGNFILDDTGNTIALRGVTVTGLDSAVPGLGQTLPDALSIDSDNLALMTGIWGLNLVRLPFRAGTMLTGNGTLSAGKILAGLDLAVTRITEAGAYVLLALEADPGSSLPDIRTQQAWRLLAKRYKDETGVLYELFASAEPLATGWLPAALSLVGTIRSQNSAAMIFVNTGNSGDLTGLPLLLPTGDPIFNVVYTLNASPPNSPGPDDGPLASFADLYPVFVSTWSDDATNPSRVSPYFGDFFARHGMGFAAANWNADPRLVTDAVNHYLTSTAWGLVAGRAAKLPMRQMLKSF
jgi:hypothetical protein